MKDARTRKIKKRLQDYADLLKEIDFQRRRLDNLEESHDAVLADFCGPPSPNLSGMPHPMGSISDPTGDQGTAMAMYNNVSYSVACIKSNIKKNEAKARAEYDAIEAMLEQLNHSDERAVIRFKYFDRLSWEDVAFMLYGDKTDYLERVESYQNRTYKVHGRALLNLSVIIEATRT